MFSLIWIITCRRGSRRQSPEKLILFGRKVRTLKSTVAGNARPAQAADQRNRKDVQGFVFERPFQMLTLFWWHKGENEPMARAAVVKSGKLYGVQGQIVKCVAL